MRVGFRCISYSEAVFPLCGCCFLQFRLSCSRIQQRAARKVCAVHSYNQVSIPLGSVTLLVSLACLNSFESIIRFSGY